MCFLEPVLSGRREREKARDRFTQGCQGSGTGSGNRAVYLVPPYFPAPGGIRHIYGGSHTGRETASPAVLRRKAAFRSHSLLQRTSMCLVLGSALWMVLVCLVSLTGHGGLMLWRGLAAVMALTAVVLEILWGRRNKQVLPGAWLKAVKNSADKGRSESMAQAALLAFIITMVLIQAGRMNIELDYDSLHYGLRSAYVLDNGKGIYENLGMINLVYTYSKGLEVLVLPLSGTPTYGFVLAFSLWCTVGILLLAADIVGRYCGQVKGILAVAILAAIPGIMNMAATAKSDNITLLHQLIIYDFICFALWDGEQGKKSSSAKIYPGFPWLSAPTC